MNKDNSLFEGCTIKIIIDEEIKIKEIKFDKWYDVIPDYESRYEVVESYINLNRDPFSELDEKLVGNYHLTLKNITKYQAFWKKDKIDLFSFKGQFVCNKNMW